MYSKKNWIIIIQYIDFKISKYVYQYIENNVE
jgi:hypothetical protein